jgi:hypothetical protein
MTWGMTAIAGSSLVSGYIGSEGAQSAAETSAASTDRASALQMEQYQQNRRDLMPWMDVAVGTRLPTGINQQTAELLARQRSGEQLSREDTVQLITAMGSMVSSGVTEADINQAIQHINEPQQGTLQELAGYGRSRTLTGDYIPESDVPAFAPGSDIQDFDIRGDRPVFDPTVDMERDPGVAFRRQEQERAINRNMAGMGKLLSGNRMEELMARGGDLASQEYGQAYGRNLGEYELGRAREATGFARDLTGFEQNRLAEEARYGRDVTGYNAEMARENLLYGRGVDEYGRQYGEETDYLNRLANLSQVGQQTAMGMGRMGSQTAAGIGANTISAGSAQAAGQIGQSSAWQNALGDFTTLGTQYAMGQPQTYAPNYNLNVPAGGATYYTPGGAGGTGMGSWDLYG